MRTEILVNIKLAFCTGDGVFYVAWAPSDHKSSTSSRFIGKISDVNAWSRPIDIQEIRRHAVGCGEVFGDVVAWSRLKAGANGSVQFVTPPSCLSSGGTDKQNFLLFKFTQVHQFSTSTAST